MILSAICMDDIRIPVFQRNDTAVTMNYTGNIIDDNRKRLV